VKVNMIGETRLTVYPNPVRGTAMNINITGLSSSEEGELRLVDGTGRVNALARFQADQAGYVSVTVPMIQAAPGIYLVQVTSTSARFVEKVIVL